MTSLNRVRCTWSGASGLPGISTFYLRTGITSADITALVAFWTGLQGIYPNAVTVSVPNSGDVLDDATGTLLGGWAVGTAASRTGTGGTNFAAGTGFAVTWNTGVVVAGRRLRGRTYIAPIGSGFYDTDGTLTATVMTNANAAASSLITAAPNLSVWHRPKLGVGGTSSVCTSALTADVVRSLRSRRT